MSNVIDLFGDEEPLDMPSATEVFEALADGLAGDDAGVACVVLLCSSDRPYMLIQGNVEDGAVDVLLGTAIVQRAADRLEEDEEEPDVLH